MRTHTSFIFLIIAAISIMGCKGRMEISGKLEGQPEIFPDYRGVTVPDNIAPLDFDYSGNLTSRLIVNGKMLKPKKGGRFIFSKRQWKKWMKENILEMTVAIKENGIWKAYNPFIINVSHDRIDPWFSCQP